MYISFTRMGPRFDKKKLVLVGKESNCLHHSLSARGNLCEILVSFLKCYPNIYSFIHEPLYYSMNFEIGFKLPICTAWLQFWVSLLLFVKVMMSFFLYDTNITDWYWMWGKFLQCDILVKYSFVCCCLMKSCARDCKILRIPLYHY